MHYPLESHIDRLGTLQKGNPAESVGGRGHVRRHRALSVEGTPFSFFMWSHWGIAGVLAATVDLHLLEDLLAERW